MYACIYVYIYNIHLSILYISKYLKIDFHPIIFVGVIILFLTLRKSGRVKKEERRDDQCEEWNTTSMQWKMDLNYQVNHTIKYFISNLILTYLILIF